MNGITAANGILALSDLTPELVSESMQSDRTPKGFYSDVILNHVASGDAYCVVNNDPVMQRLGIEQNSIVQSLKSNIKKLDAKASKMGRQFPQCQVAKVGENTILVNVAAHAALIAAQNEES